MRSSTFTRRPGTLSTSISSVICYVRIFGKNGTHRRRTTLLCMYCKRNDLRRNGRRTGNDRGRGGRLRGEVFRTCLRREKARHSVVPYFRGHLGGNKNSTL